MFWLFGSDLALYILSFLELKDVFALYLLSRDVHRFLVEHDATIFHQLAILHRFVSVGTSLDDAVHAQDNKGDWLQGVQSWEQLCRRCVLMERNWAGQGTVMQGAYMTFEGDVRSFEVDEVDRTIIAIVDQGGKHKLVVHAIEDGRELWTLAGISQVKHSNGVLLLTCDVARNPGGIEVWIRMSDALAVAEQRQYATPLREPSPLALTVAQQQVLQRLDTSGDTRGRYFPHGFIPSFTGDFFRTCCFRHPHAAVIDIEESHVAQVYDVVHGTHVYRIDLDKLASASARQERPFQTASLLLDIDLTSDYLCAAFDSGVLITSLRDSVVSDGASSSMTSTVLFDEDLSPWESQQSSPQLKKTDTADEGPVRGFIISDEPIMSLSCSPAGTMERYQVVSASEEEGDTQALVPSSVRTSSFFISTKFSPDGHHLLFGSAFGIVYLLPNVPDLLSGLAKPCETVQKISIGEPLRDLFWEEQRHRVLIRTEPGDTFLADLNPGYHKTPSISPENLLALETARIQRLSDFCTPYATLFGNAHMTTTGLWFVWNALRLREGVLDRTGRGPVYGMDREKAISVCFMNFNPTLDP